MNVLLQFKDQQFAFKRVLEHLPLHRILKVSHKQFKGIPEAFGIQYTDAEGDLIDIICQDDLATLKESLKGQTGQIILTINPDGYPVFVDFKKAKEECQRKWHQIKHKFVQKKLEVIKESVRSMLPEIVEEVRRSIIVESQVQQQKPQIQEEPKVSPKVQVVPKVTHRHVRCDGCDSFPMVGIRYKCSTCEDFDYCESCEAEKPHEHPFLKIRNPEQCPSFIITGLGDRCSRNIPNQISQFFQGEINLKDAIGTLSKAFKIFTQPETKEQSEKVSQPEKISEPVQEEVQQTNKVQEEQVNVQIETETCETEIELTQEQQIKLVQLSELLSVNPSQIRQVIIDFDGFPVEEIAQYMIESPEYLDQLKRSIYQ